ncbi:uncharacterized protein LOC123523921 isoform X1 [Mercenaria mercenaria]|uniref:uncharacterized protein LOC123523921 isoform X1 n=1 Tax=Mercenaria mercenaria TaxID=6596 RepID=UPI00234F0DA8|nr:uncharacterized protein LOC123523921 isoform X1 [Mercenaria mercenaria]XP_053395383.1 uncharacterized protein LOC123523921 isoform X1 [Mercenaria mercenaria]
MKKLFDMYDILLFTEPWSSSAFNYDFENFQSYILNRKYILKGSKRSSGGIMVYVNNKLKNYVEFVKSTNDCILWLKFKGELFELKYDVLLCLTYNIPQGSRREIFVDSNIYEMIADDMMYFENLYEHKCEFIISGDFNARVGEMADFVTNDNTHLSLHNLLPEDCVQDKFLPRKNMDKKVNEQGKFLLEFCKSTGLRILNGRMGLDKNIGKYTCINSQGSSTIDYVLCRDSLWECINSFEIMEPNILSDHCIVSFSMKSKSQIEIRDFQRGDDDADKISYKYKWNDENKGTYIEQLNSENITYMFNELNNDVLNAQSNVDLDTSLNTFCDILNSVCTPLFKKKCSSSSVSCSYDKEKAYYDVECNQLKSSYYKLLNIYRNDNCDDNKKNMVHARSEYKKTVRKKKYIYDKSQTQKLESAKLSNAKQYWNLLKGSVVKSKTSLTTKDFLEYFKSINDPDSVFFQPDEDVIYFSDRYLNGESEVMFNELNIPFSQTEIIKACKNLNTGKSGGPDYFLNEFFKYGIMCDSFLTILCSFFNKLFDAGYFPEAWTEGFVVPLHKKGDIDTASNYRGITLLSTFGKLFTKVINNRLNTWAEYYHVYIEAQAGFRQNMGTIDNIFVLHGLINHLLNNNKRMYAVFVDFTKAFDFLVRDVIWYKLIKIGIRGKMLDIVKSIYCNVRSRVKYNNNISNEDFSCLLGVRQGESLSPFLFSIYLNDIEEHFMIHGFNGIDTGMLKMFLLLYADDIHVVIMAESEEELRKGLFLLEDYCDRWKLSVNSTKTKIMIFKKGGQLKYDLQFLFKGQVLDIVNNFTYLGIVFTTGGSFKMAYDTLAGQATKAMYKLKSALVKYPGMPIKSQLELFDKLILPILNYGSEIWGLNESMVLERVHLSFCKRLLGVKIQTQNNFIYGELGRTSLLTRRAMGVIKYWLKIIQMKNEKYVKVVYDLMCRQLEVKPNSNSWAKSVKNLLQSLGFYDVWLFQEVGDNDAFISVLKTRLTDVFIQNWRADINDSTRAKSYALFSSFKLQPYLKLVNISKFRNALCRLRV